MASGVVVAALDAAAKVQYRQTKFGTKLHFNPKCQYFQQGRVVSDIQSGNDARFPCQLCIKLESSGKSDAVAPAPSTSTADAVDAADAMAVNDSDMWILFPSSNKGVVLHSRPDCKSLHWKRSKTVTANERSAYKASGAWNGSYCRMCATEIKSSDDTPVAAAAAYAAAPAADGDTWFVSGQDSGTTKLHYSSNCQDLGANNFRKWKGEFCQKCARNKLK